MRDIEFYAQVLGLVDPWFVEDVDLSVENKRVDITVLHHEGRLWPCPKCQAELAIYDHADERVWRHLDTGGFPTWLHARPPRVKCPTDGVRQVDLPWAEPRSHFTRAFERFAIDVMKETDVSGAANILKASWDECWGIMSRAVARGRALKEHQVPALIGVDEKAARKGHSYLTLVYDIAGGTVEYIAEDRTQASLDGYFSSFSPEELDTVKAVVMDMWPAYINSVHAHLEDAEKKIVFDRFHIMKHMGEAVDTVRKREHRALRAEGIEILTGSKYMWLYAEKNLPDKHRATFADLKALNLKTARAWAIKESLSALWHYHRLGWATKFYAQWFFWATHSRLQPVIDVAYMIKRHLYGVLNYFSAARITNAAAEGLNSKIQTIKKMAYGFRNKEHFKTAIFFHCGGLQLYPATHREAG
ncbi:MAG TPA: ISL3 family transposase [Acidimicrobiales bacterium]|jgi:transposase